MANNLKKLRERDGISKKKLAETVGTTQLQIQRIESNKYPAHLNLARALSAALDKPINAVFPGAAKALAALDEELAQPMHVSREMYEKLRAVGLEGDTRRYKLKVIMRGHRDPMFFPFDANELDRLFSAIQREDAGDSGMSFIVFDSNELRVAINLQATMFSHFLWDVDIGKVIRAVAPEVDEEVDPSQRVQVFLAENSAPLTIGAEMENGDDIDNGNNYLNNIFGLLENDVQPNERLHIVDEDGESAFLRAGDVALLTVPLWLLDPDESPDEEDDEET